MSSFWESGPLPEWKELQRWLGKEVPWQLAEQWEKARDPSWVREYVERLVSRVKPEGVVGLRQASATPAKVTKEARHLTVTLALPEGAAADSRLRVFATSDRIKVTGLPDGRTRSIRLPGRVYPKSGRAQRRKDRLVVRFRRRPAEREEVELFIRG